MTPVDIAPGSDSTDSNSTDAGSVSPDSASPDNPSQTAPDTQAVDPPVADPQAPDTQAADPPVTDDSVADDSVADVASAAKSSTQSAVRPAPGHAATASGANPAGNGSADQDDDPTGRFTVRLANFEGPFDLLLQLISQHEMDVTEVALHKVTDDFIAHIRSMGEQWDLDETTEFLVIAATLLDLKAARLLPSADVENEDDLALLEARDLLFARLLQYRAYKQVAALFGELEATALRRYPRSVALEDRYADLLPEVMLGVNAAKFAEIAAAVFRPKPPPTVGLDHLHVARVSVREHAALLRIRLAEAGTATFSTLVADCEHTLEVVARFLALLELYRQATIAFDQADPLGELNVRWTGGSVQDAEAASAADRSSNEDEDYG